MAHSVSLSWVASVDPVDGYNVYKGTNPPGNEAATPLNSTLIVGTTYVDSTVVAGQRADYVVTAVKAGVESIHSNEVTTVIPPGPPTGLVAAAA